MPLFWATYNIGTTGQERLTNLLRSEHLPSSDEVVIICLQECRTRPDFPVTSTEDGAELARVLCLDGRRARFLTRGIMTWDAGILVNQPWPILALDSGSRHVYVRFNTGKPLLDGHSGIIHIWSIHGAFDEQYWLKDEAKLTAVTDIASDDLVIIGADWNSYPNPQLDAGAGDRHPMWHIIEARLNHLSLVDGFRFHRPTLREYSRIAVAPKSNHERLSARRIDSIWVSPWAARHIYDFGFHWLTSDHRLVTLFIKQPSDLPRRGGGFWRVHPGLLHDQEFCRLLVSFFQNVPFNTSPGDSLRAALPTDWFHFKERLRLVVYNASLRCGKRQKSLSDRCHNLARQIDQFDIATPEAASVFPSLLADYQHAKKAAAATEALRYKKRLDAEYLRPTSWLAVRRSTDGSSLQKLRMSDGSIADTHHKQLQLVEDFYSSLFAPLPITDATVAARNYLLFQPRQILSLSARQALAQPFSMDEFLLSMRFASDHSAPGPDGIPYFIYNLGRTCVAQRLASLTNCLCQGLSLPPSQPNLRGTLLYKKGDMGLLSNYRPLSIADSDTRIIGRALATRLQRMAFDCLPWPQAGFVLGRRAADSASILVGLVQYMRLKRIYRPPTDPTAYVGQALQPTLHVPDHILVLSLDQTKAYDRVSRDWLFAVLAAYGLPTSLTNLLRAMYDHPQVTFYAHGFPGSPVRYRRGVLQGEPSSCLLYNLSLQPFLSALVTAAIGVMLPFLQERLTYLAFADDVVVFIDNPEQLEAFSKLIATYSTASDAELSATKSGHLILSSTSSEPPAWMRECGFPNLVSEGSSEAIYLGYPLPLFGPSPLETWHRRINAAKTRLACFARPEGDLFARAKLLNTFAFSRLWHTLTLSVPTPLMHHDMRILARRYLFKGARSWIRWEYATTPLLQGGLGLQDPEQMTISLHGAHLARVLTKADAVGDFHRNGIRAAINGCGTSEAALFHRTSRWWRLTGTTAQRSETIWAYWLYVLKCCKLGLKDRCWERLDVDHTCALPWANPVYGVSPPFTFTDRMPQRETYKRVIAGGFINWADCLWWIDRPRYDVVSRPFATPTASGLLNHWRQTPFRPTYFAPDSNHNVISPVTRGAAPLRGIWNQYWPALPLSLRSRLEELGSKYDPVPDLSDSRSSGQPHVRPLRLDPAAMPFPWHETTMRDCPIEEVTVRKLRLSLTPQEPIVPDWPFNGSPTVSPVIMPSVFGSRPRRKTWPAEILQRWKLVWAELHRLPLTSGQRSTVFLFLHRRSWLSRTSGHALQAAADLEAQAIVEDDPAANVLPTDTFLDDDDDDNDDESAFPASSSDGSNSTTAGGRGRGRGRRGAAPSQLAESSQRGGPAIGLMPSSTARRGFPTSSTTDDDINVWQTDICPAQCHPTIKDSVQHGFIDCEVVQQRVWRQALPFLQHLVGASIDLPPIDAHSVVLAWPRPYLFSSSGTSLSSVSHFRLRAAFWRALVITYIDRCRAGAIAHARKTDTAAIFTFDTFCLMPTLRKYAYEALSAQINTINEQDQQPQSREQKFALLRNSYIAGGSLFALSDHGTLSLL